MTRLQWLWLVLGAFGAVGLANVLIVAFLRCAVREEEPREVNQL